MITALDTPSLGDRSYLLSDGDVAIAIDPQRDIERMVAAADDLGVAITHVVETHIHNDYVTGGLALAKRTGAEYVLPPSEDTGFGHSIARDGQQILTGSLRLMALATPGHTLTHTAYIAFQDDSVIGVFSGGSMLYEAVGRTDLVSPHLTHRLSLDQHASVRRLAEQAEGPVPLYPTHGFGSHCSSGTAEIHRSGTVEDERGRNPALLEADPEAFAASLIAGFGPYPRYYAHMGAANRAGPEATAPHPPPLLDKGALTDHLASGSWVVDLRPRRAFAEEHLPGTVNVELRNDLPTYLGWVHDRDTPLVLLAPGGVELREAQVMLSRIGLDPLAGAVVVPEGGLPDLGATVGYDVVGWKQVNEHRPDEAIVLDVRDHHEFGSGHHSAAIHIPFHDVMERIEDLEAGRPVWVYCATGNRAAVAASLLERAGRSVSLIDDFCLPGDVPG